MASLARINASKSRTEILRYSPPVSGLEEEDMKSPTTERTGCNPKHDRGWILIIRLLVVIAAIACPNVQANDDTAAAQWNIMVVPSSDGRKAF
jgi:hypothetical protein